MPTETELRSQLKRYSDVLNERVREATVLDDYYDGEHPYPPLVKESQVKQAYRMLMELSVTNWPQSIVDATDSRLEVQGLAFGKAKDDHKRAWEMWQENGLDAEAGLVHQATLTAGRSYALVWGDGSPTPRPKVTLEHASMCLVEYEPGDRRKRRGALRRWRDGDRWYANLYTREAIYKFISDAEEIPAEAAYWKRRDVRDETWPLDNPLGDVPVVEFAINRTLRPGSFGNARGDFARNLRQINRINYKTFSGLVALTWSGFPLRYVIGDPILYEKKDDGTDDKDKPIPPFDAVASAVAQFTNPDAKVGQLPEANIDNYSAKDDVVALAAVTSTPAFHMLPGEMVNISADAMRAGQDSHVSKVQRYHRPLGESWEDLTRLMFRVKDPDDPRGIDPLGEVRWRDAEHRSLAERADAATKLASIGLPWQGIGEVALNLTPQQINRLQVDRTGEMLDQVLREQAQNGGPVPTPKNGLPAR